VRDSSRSEVPFEEKAVQCFKCNPSWPICLYDFTFKNLYVHHFHFKPKEDVKDLFIEDYVQTIE